MMKLCVKRSPWRAVHRREVAEGIRVRQLAVLLEALLQIAALHVVEAARVAAVVAGEDAALRRRISTPNALPPPSAKTS